MARGVHPRDPLPVLPRGGRHTLASGPARSLLPAHVNDIVRAGDRLDTGKVFEFVKANRADHKVATMCRVLGVSASGYYAWLRRGPSPRARRDAGLAARIEAIHRDSRGTYGAPGIHAELREEGERLGRKRVARLMRESGLRGATFGFGGGRAVGGGRDLRSDAGGVSVPGGGRGCVF